MNANVLKDKEEGERWDFGWGTQRHGRGLSDQDLFVWCSPWCVGERFGCPASGMLWASSLCVADHGLIVHKMHT